MIALSRSRPLWVCNIQCIARRRPPLCTSSRSNAALLERWRNLDEIIVRECTDGAYGHSRHAFSTALLNGLKPHMRTKHRAAASEISFARKAIACTIQHRCCKTRTETAGERCSLVYAFTTTQMGTNRFSPSWRT